MNDTQNIIINNKYILHEKIGNGKFGNIFKGIHKKNLQDVAIKLENNDAPIKLLKNETTILNYLYNNGCHNLPSVFWYGIYQNKICMVMTLYECSLQDYIKIKQLTSSKIISIIIQCLDIIESIHNKYVIHRDIKPQNFMIKNGELFIIDFGFSTFYIDSDKNHIPMNTSNNIIGTPKYISINIHNGNEPSRRDDLISIGYIYIYLVCGELPWDYIKKNNNDEQYDEIHILNYKNQQRKLLKSIENIENLFKDTDNTIYNFLKYCYSLNFIDTPNYKSINHLLLKTI